MRLVRDGRRPGVDGLGDRLTHGVPRAGGGVSMVEDMLTEQKWRLYSAERYYLP